MRTGLREIAKGLVAVTFALGAPAFVAGVTLVGGGQALAADNAASSAEPSARFVATYKGGDAVGVKVYRVKRGGAAAQLGFMNGDIIKQMTGVVIDSRTSVDEPTRVV